MTFDYEIYPEQRMIVTRFKGRFTFDSLRSSVERMWQDPRYSLNYDGIVDISDMSVGIAMADFRAMLEVVRHSAKISRGRWAAVATTPLAAACGMLYQRTVALRHPFEVFSTVEGACSYLGVQWAGKTDMPAGSELLTRAGLHPRARRRDTRPHRSTKAKARAGYLARVPSR